MKGTTSCSIAAGAFRSPFFFTSGLGTTRRRYSQSSGFSALLWPDYALRGPRLFTADQPTRVVAAARID